MGTFLPFHSTPHSTPYSGNVHTLYRSHQGGFAREQPLHRNRGPAAVLKLTAGARDSAQNCPKLSHRPKETHPVHIDRVYRLADPSAPGPHSREEGEIPPHRPGSSSQLEYYRAKVKGVKAIIHPLFYITPKTPTSGRHLGIDLASHQHIPSVPTTYLIASHPILVVRRSRWLPIPSDTTDLRSGTSPRSAIAIQRPAYALT